jgi:ribosomal protein RSM22 (predicted rRNA methylase)
MGLKIYKAQSKRNRLRCRREDNIKIHITKTMHENVNSIRLG